MHKALPSALLGITMLVFRLTGFWTTSWWLLAPVLAGWGFLAVRAATLSRS